MGKNPYLKTIKMFANICLYFQTGEVAPSLIYLGRGRRIEFPK